MFAFIKVTFVMLSLRSNGKLRLRHCTSVSMAILISVINIGYGLVSLFIDEEPWSGRRLDIDEPEMEKSIGSKDESHLKNS